MSTNKSREKFNQLTVDIATKNNRVKGLFDEADKRPDGACTADEMAEIKKLNQEISELDQQRAEIKEMIDIRLDNEKRNKDMTEPAGKIPFPTGSDGGAQGSTFKSFGEMVLEDEGMSDYLKRFHNGFSTVNQLIQSPKVDVKTLITGTSLTSAGPLINQDRKPIVDFAYARPLTLLDLITQGETSGDTVEYARNTSVTNAAAPVAEATATGDGSGAKPESAMAFELVTESVRTIAHWVAASNRAMSDAGQLRTYIDSFLRYGLEEELEDQILNGSGAGQNFTGVLNTPNTTAQAFDTDLLVTTRKARTKVRVTGRANPTAYVFNPADWETIDLLKDNESRYFFGGPMALGNPRLWGLPVVECEGMPAGTGVVTDWKLVVLWNRMQTMISMSNSHSDFYVRNLVAILAEMRAAMGALRPKAIVEIDLTA